MDEFGFFWIWELGEREGRSFSWEIRDWPGSVGRGEVLEEVARLMRFSTEREVELRREWWRRICMLSTSPAAAAWWRAERPLLSTSSGSAPWLNS